MTLDQRDRSIISQVAVKGAIELIGPSGFADTATEAFEIVLKDTAKIVYDTIIELALSGAVPAVILSQFPGAEAVPVAQPSNVTQIAAYQQAGGPAPVPGVASGSNSSDEAKWQRFFADPNGYYDNRGKKNNPKSPDFKSKSGGREGEALWIESKGTPDWVRARLAGPPVPQAAYSPEPF